MKAKHLFLLMGLMIITGSKTFAVTDTIRVGDGFAFTPDSLTIHLGDAIVWIYNGSGIMHTTTSISIPGSATAWNNPLNSTSTTFTYTPTVEGTYNYQCNFHFSMGMVGKFIVDPPLSVNNVEKLNDFTITPNPASTEIKLHGSVSVMSVKVFDLSGRYIGTLEQTHSASSDTYFNISLIPAGMYTLQIDTKNGTTAQKLSVQR